MTTRLILASLTMVALSACGGGGGGGDSDQTSATPSPPAETVTGNVNITLSFPVGTSVQPSANVQGHAAAHALKQAQSYISAKTQSVSIVLTSVNGAAPATPVGVTVDVKPGGACVVNGASLNCTVTLAAPVGNDEFELNNHRLKPVG